ncbi:cell surface elastin binding protein EbpS [Bifidobacterium actinocoloniiforme DSM 22766]|uniref:Cell surface elastin binding protein EbpS n=1 Tax=Bifidobacterium actinocoloniiforme DSM 22766 TaxID=1437605 RepID=A0A086Z176_9BIFI|nr:DUF6466 family protein [Bifidobacterium actinocoloniiforme]AKV55440.1 hypothetical protein AB656_03500 [Bifidobacterium actinocoloniiforme DSM 22766]KFI40276.1 cell surface elastin binding protein EbpS [Bifidobacterium actinocoloniiforme DSM 22766]
MNDGHQSSLRAMTGNGPEPRATFRLRVILGVLALALLVVSGIALWNAQAVSSYNQASAALSENLSQAAKPTADASKLKVAQGQVDDLFGQAGQGRAILLPGTRQAIDRNAALSRQLTAALDQLDQQQSNGSQAQQGQNASGAKRKQSQEQQGLSDEQRRKVEEMLKRNQDLQSAAPAPTSKPSSPSGQQAKPW